MLLIPGPDSLTPSLDVVVEAVPSRRGLSLGGRPKRRRRRSIGVWRRGRVGGWSRQTVKVHGFVVTDTNTAGIQKGQHAKRLLCVVSWMNGAYLGSTRGCCTVGAP